jgi:translation initiation factor 2D
VEKVPDSELPIKCEELYSKVMLPIRPAGTTVDIKKSGYKKLTKLYTVWEKKGLLTVKAVHKIVRFFVWRPLQRALRAHALRAACQDNIIAVNRTHAAYVAAVAAAKAAPTTADAGSAAGAAAAPAAALIEVDPMYRSPSSLRPIFGDLLAVNKERLLSEADVAGALRAYAAANGLSPGGDGVIALDELLSGGLYGKKEPETVGTPVVAAALLPRVLAKLNQFTRLRITRAGGAAPEEVLQKGSIKNIRITAEDRHAGRKHVTRVTGLEFFAIEPEELSSRIQKGFNTSCSVALLPGKFETLKEVAAQGNLLQEVTDLLQKEYGIPTAYLDVVSKLK